jgi:hypothetical protein
MKNETKTLGIIVVVVTVAFSLLAVNVVVNQALAGAGQNKFTICQSGNTKTVGSPSVPAHERNQGADLGACPTS